jgi:hypothetical protein
MTANDSRRSSHSLGISPDRVYLNFTGVDAGNWSWNWNTFG